MCEVIKIGDSTAFVCNCGKQADHECNDDNLILILSDGNRVPDTKENQQKYRNEVRGGSVACSICNRAAIDAAPFF